MSNPAAFLKENDYTDFKRLNGGIQRSIVEIPVKPMEIDLKNPASPPQHILSPHIVKLVGDLIKKQGSSDRTSLENKWFGCACIEIKEDDGMTWSAETASFALSESTPRFNRFHLAISKDEYSLPVISNLIGIRSFLRLATEHKLGTLSTTSNRWLAPLIVGLAILAAAAIKLLESLQKISANNTTYLLVLASAALGLASQYLVDYLKARTRTKKIENFKAEEARILAMNTPPDNYNNFISSLADELQTIKFPRFVIIDDYEQLDETTKRVIRSYFSLDIKHAAGAEYWVIFEGQSGEKFSAEIIKGHKKNNGSKESRYTYSKNFRQLFLTEEEKRRVIEMHHRPAEAMNYQAIKLICVDTSEGKERIKKLIEEYRKQHPKDSRYAELEFLYLLSLTASKPGDFYLGYEDLKGNLAASTVLRADILKQLLAGTRLAKYEFQEKLTQIEEKFPTTMIIAETKRQKKLHIHHQTALALTESTGVLELPRPELGHLFWSLYWYDTQPKVPEAFWIRKLDDHLKQAEPPIVEGIEGAETHNIITKQLFEAFLYAINGSLRTGVFEDTLRLLEKTPYLLEIGGLTSSDSHKRRLLKLCWEAYSVLGYDQILGIVLDLYAMPGRQAQAKAKEEKEDLLEKLFFESMPLPPASRASVMPDFFGWIGGARQTVESVSHFARARSAWLALTISPLVSPLDSTQLHQAALHSTEILEDLTQKALDRIEDNSEETVRITDIATLSLALWCNALRFSPAVTEIARVNHVKSFKALVELATDAILKASYLKEESVVRSERFLRVDFLVSGLARELYAISIASILTANQYLIWQGVEVVDQPLLKKINDLLMFGEEIFNYQLPQASTRQNLTSARLVERIDAMLKFCGIIWDMFGLTRLLEFINIRRVHFKAICLGMNYAREEAYESLLESIGSSINDIGFSGLITNLVVADCLRQAGEIEAYYMVKAGKIVIEGDFGSQMQQELSFGLINKFHHLNYDLDIFLSNLLQDTDDHEIPLLRLLKELPKHSVVNCLLALFNAPVSTTPPEIRDTLQQTGEFLADFIQWPDVKREVKAFVDYFSIKEKFRSKEPLNTSEIISSWKDYKDLPAYAAVLTFLVKSDPSPDTFQECLTVLDHDPRQDRTTFYIYLALEIAREKQKSGNLDDATRAIITRYLRLSVELWKGEMTAEINREIYSRLLSMDPDNQAYYFSEVQKWEFVRFRRDQMERLPKLVKEGRFFLIFEDYCFTMLPWGLASDVEWKTIYSYRSLPSEKRTEILTEWQKEGGAVPPALYGKGVYSEFIYLGFCLFGPPNDQEPRFDDSRVAFNQSAYDAMPDLLSIITELPALPDSIKDLLGTYSRRFFYNTVAD